MNKYTVAKDGFSHQGKNHPAGSTVELDEQAGATFVKEGKLTPAQAEAKGE